MPRDDLTIDFVERMPAQESVDPAQILDDFFYRFQNIPEEIRFIQAEIADKDRVVGESLRAIEDRDAKIQRWIRTNGGHVPNPREDSLRAQIRENYARAQKSSDEKLALAEKLQMLYDRQILYLDRQIKGLTDRAEPGFTEPDEIPSLLRNSPANIPAPSFRATGGARSGAAAASSKPSTPVHAANTPTLLIANKTAASQIRSAQAQQQHAASAPATPAASMMGSRAARETSAGPGSGVPKRGPRANAILTGVPPSHPGSLARHSSLGPGPTKSGTATGAGGVVRAGSAGPRTSVAKATGAGGVSRKGTPGAPGRKKTTGAAGGAPGTSKSSLFRVKKASSKNSPASAESDLSEAESASVADEEPERRGGTSGAGSGGGSQRGGSRTPSRAAAGTTGAQTGGGGGNGPAGGRGVVVRGGAREDAEMGDAEDEEAGDDSKYCLCQNVSFGDMVACDNDHCPYEWFHWSCVGLKNEPNGKWFCPVCTEKMGKKAK